MNCDDHSESSRGMQTRKATVAASLRRRSSLIFDSKGKRPASCLPTGRSVDWLGFTKRWSL